MRYVGNPEHFPRQTEGHARREKSRVDRNMALSQALRSQRESEEINNSKRHIVLIDVEMNWAR
jgi:hypothetical protein